MNLMLSFLMPLVGIGILRWVGVWLWYFYTDVSFVAGWWAVVFFHGWFSVCCWFGCGIFLPLLILLRVGIRQWYFYTRAGLPRLHEIWTVASSALSF
jgi:hypothetical protein